MKIKFPTKYDIVYPEKNIQYYDPKNHKQIKPLLTQASNGYCMYCGNKILINNRNSGQIEHSIEKSQGGKDIKYLKHCKFNMSIVCAPCNLSFKKNNILPINVTNEHNCNKSCTVMCSEYIKNYEEHCEKNKIILLPHGIKVKDKDIYYEIDYSLLNLLFIPSYNDEYSDEDRDYIQSHIDRFGLNSPEYMPDQVLHVCEDFINSETVPVKGRYNNLIADQFIDYLSKVNEVSTKNAVKLCEIILIFSSI